MFLWLDTKIEEVTVERQSHYRIFDQRTTAFISVSVVAVFGVHLRLNLKFAC